MQSFTEVCALLRRLLTERPRFAAAARVLELQPRSKGLSLQGLLVTTVQRLPRYVLLLRELLQHATVPGVVATLPSGSPPEGKAGAAEASSTGTVHAVEAALEKLRDVTVQPYSRTRARRRGPASRPLLPLLPRPRPRPHP